LKKNLKDKDQIWEVEQLELEKMAVKLMKMLNKKQN
jgi:hypothetical protein